MNQEAEIVLRKSGLKVTKSRKALLAVLMKDHGPHTMEELRGGLKSEVCDLVTVYRCISTFEAAGLVRRCDFGDGTHRYEYQGEEGSHHHHHVICRHCRRVKKLDECFASDLEDILSREGYTDVTHSLEFFASCSLCSQKQAVGKTS